MTALRDWAERVNARLEVLLPEAPEGAFEDGERPWIVNNAMRYSLMAGGKRLRPSMMLAAVEMLGGDGDIALDYACAVEMIHTYSLIHDDLPGMDDDSLRRGRPTSHVVFGVGQAILAGDGLLNLAFETMLGAAERRKSGHRSLLSAAKEVALGAGARGMIGGQCMDLYCEKAGGAGGRELSYIHRNKTARMFIHPLRAAALISGAGDAELDALTRFGEAFGLLFQATDDILDVVGDSGEIGKSVGKDEASGKLTCVSLYGLGGARAFAEEMRRKAEAALGIFGDKAVFFAELLTETIGRTR